MTSIVLIPTALLFGDVAHAQDIFRANILLVLILAVGPVAVVLNSRHRQTVAK